MIVFQDSSYYFENSYYLYSEESHNSRSEVIKDSRPGSPILVQSGQQSGWGCDANDHELNYDIVSVMREFSDGICDTILDGHDSDSYGLNSAADAAANIPSFLTSDSIQDDGDSVMKSARDLLDFSSESSRYFFETSEDLLYPDNSEILDLSPTSSDHVDMFSEEAGIVFEESDADSVGSGDSFLCQVETNCIHVGITSDEIIPSPSILAEPNPRVRTVRSHARQRRRSGANSDGTSSCNSDEPMSSADSQSSSASSSLQVIHGRNRRCVVRGRLAGIQIFEFQTRKSK